MKSVKRKALCIFEKCTRLACLLSFASLLDSDSCFFNCCIVFLWHEIVFLDQDLSSQSSHIYLYQTFSTRLLPSCLRSSQKPSFNLNKRLGSCSQPELNWYSDIIHFWNWFLPANINWYTDSQIFWHLDPSTELCSRTRSIQPEISFGGKRRQLESTVGIINWGRNWQNLSE